MKKYVRASLVDTFLKYHEDPNNYAANPDGFDKMYSILDKYDNSNGNDNVDVAFRKATPEDQKKMVSLITPKFKVGQKGYSKDMYQKALNYMIENADREYCDGVIDAFEALAEEGFIRLDDFEETDL